MRKVEILWRNPAHVERINSLADQALDRLIPVAENILDQYAAIDFADKKALTHLDYLNRTIASLVQAIKSFVGMASVPVSEDAEDGKSPDDLAKLIDAVKSQRPQSVDISKFTPDTSSFAKPKVADE